MYKNILLILITILLFGCKKEPQHLVRIEGKLIPIVDTIKENSDINTYIKPYKEKLQVEMEQVLSYTSNDISKNDGEYESTLGNLMADLCFEKGNPIFKSRTGKNIDFALFNHGGLRAPIDKGDIKTKHAFQLMPFENMLVVVEMSGEKVNELANYIVTSKRAHPVSNQLNLNFKEDDSFEVLINNKPVENNKNYFVITSDYLQNGGDNMIFFKDPVNLYNLDYKVRAAIIDYFTEIDTVKVNLDNRIKKIN